MTDWPADEATEPEGATFLASHPLIRHVPTAETAAMPAWASVDHEVPTHSDGSAVFTSARTVVLETTMANAVYDPSLFEDVTEPSRPAASEDDDGNVFR